MKESTWVVSKTGRAGSLSGYGYLWWVAAESVHGIPAGSYTAAGWGGHRVFVLPDLDMVVVHRAQTEFRRPKSIDYDRLVGTIIDAYSPEDANSQTDSSTQPMPRKRLLDEVK
ncbi:MAG: hypothetical protein GY757_34445 [bacterium]|nr:hypothetical protein [bacterium]